jgi:halocyanin-like protein
MGEAEVTVEVGAGDTALAFGPAAVHVDLGATVVWEWTGKGGAHNVVAEDGTFESGDPVGEAGATFRYTFEQAGIYRYYCNPHRAVGMKGAVVVGTDYPSK